MGEMDCCYKSDVEMAVDRIVERRFKERRDLISTDAIDRNLKDKIRQEVKDELLILKGE